MSVVAHPEGSQSQKSHIYLRNQPKNSQSQKQNQQQETIPQSKRHGARNQQRHQILTKWLIQTFPHILSDKIQNNDDKPNNQINACQRGPYVLDVAGGKGELAARLSLCHSVQNIVLIDPRPADVVSCYETVVVPKLPKKWQQRHGQKKDIDKDYLKNILAVRGFRQLEMCFDESTLLRSDDLQYAIHNASLLIGMHADSATEHVVDAALKHQKPFVVIPCCVFPNLFSKRVIKIKDENEKSSVTKEIPVRTHDQFCTYLMQKDKRFVMEKLPFDGRNIAIWWDGK
mmetsp:Transcript_42640/g.51198  ORF Transcript_42640/g.51198 Transcript_42640/m.51198 type:complete len:286 (+) Transcript_42640:34-891(+)